MRQMWALVFCTILASRFCSDDCKNLFHQEDEATRERKTGKGSGQLQIQVTKMTFWGDDFMSILSVEMSTGTTSSSTANTYRRALNRANPRTASSDRSGTPYRAGEGRGWIRRARAQPNAGGVHRKPLYPLGARHPSSERRRRRGRAGVSDADRQHCRVRSAGEPEDRSMTNEGTPPTTPPTYRRRDGSRVR